MSTLHRRGIALTSAFLSALVCGGLALTVAPPAQAEDDNGLLVLTDSQVEDLAERVRLDPYAAADGAAYDPQGTGVRPDADSVPTDEGSGSSLDALSVKATTRSALEGATGMAVTAPVAGAGGDYFVLNAFGYVQRRTAAGQPVWQRDNASFYADWQVSPIRPWQTEPYPARIVMGYNAVGLFTPASDNGFATGDLTGDGVADVAFTASVGTTPFRPFTAPGATAITGTFVTVLDGRTGETLWHGWYGGAYNIALVGKTLVVADSPYFNINTPADSRTTLTGIRFSDAGGDLTPAETWTYDAGPRLGHGWADLEPLDGGLLAASWNVRKNGTVSPGSGHTVVIDTADGTVQWAAENALYSRQLQVDADRGRLVAMEHSDPSDGVQYQLATYSLADGARTTVDTRINALPIALEVGNLRGDERPEYAISESTLDPSLFVNANTVRALDADDGRLLWSHTVKRDPANTHDGIAAWGLRAVDERLVASYQDDLGRETADNRGSARRAALTVLAGSTGAVRWEQRGVVASQMWVEPFRKEKGWRLRTVDTDQNVRTYNLGSGKQEALAPLRAALWSAASTDLNGDGKSDLVVGGQSNGVWAFDGPSLVAGGPRLLWQASVPGQVHQLVNADVDGDGRDEIVVAADTAVAVVDPSTGAVRTTIDGRGQFVRTVAADDLDGDGDFEVVLATDAVRAYDGRGSLLWTYSPPAEQDEVVFADVSFGDGHVYAQYASRDAFKKSDVAAGGVALRGTDGGIDWSFAPSPEGSVDGKVMGIPLRAGTFASQEIPYADGHAVVYTWVARQALPNANVIFVEIRDGRTGELLHTGLGGGPLTLGSFFAGPEGLVMGSTVTLRTYAAGGQDYSIYTLPQIESAGFATGPGGQRMVVAAFSGGFDLYDPSVLTAGRNYPTPAARVGIIGGREFFVGDLDADGVDEVVSLNFDESGADRTAALLGGGYSMPFSAIRQLTTITLETP